MTDERDEDAQTTAGATPDVTPGRLNVEYAVEIARGAGLTAEQLGVLGDMLRRHATSRELRELRAVILDLLARYADAERAADGDAAPAQAEDG